jgi:hypothetical protein
MVELQFSSSWKRLPTKGEIKDRVIESFQKKIWLIINWRD